MIIVEAVGATVRLGCMLLACWSISVEARTWFVRESASAGGDGNSWENAITSVQRAIDRARPGDDIWIANGVYHPENVREIIGDKCFGASIELKDGVSLYGGFVGRETSLNQRLKCQPGDYPWSFAAETVLQQRQESFGGVLVSSQQLEIGLTLDGLTISCGRALGKGVDGKGGGLCGTGRIQVRRCRFVGNVAWNGGGIYWTGPMTLEDCQCSGNDALAEMGRGGGCALTGTGFCIRQTLFSDNGGAGKVAWGGGIYAQGAGCIVNCTICGNMSVSEGSGVCMGGDVSMVNSIVWGNSAGAPQVRLDGENCRCEYTAVEGLALDGQGNWSLAGENTGKGGCHVNDNSPGRYFPCFLQPEKNDYRLGRGGYPLKRGKGEQPLDLGAFQTEFPGNLAVAVQVEAPVIYGEESEVSVIWGALSPRARNASLKADDTFGVVSQVREDFWKALWKMAGNCMLSLEADCTGGWNSRVCQQAVLVRPRPLILAADDVSGEPTELTWYIEGGKLAGMDRIAGTLSQDPSKRPSGSRAILQGTLHVEDGNNGGNYAVRFREGIIHPDE